MDDNKVNGGAAGQEDMDAFGRKIICALDTSSLDEARKTIWQLKDHVGAFKVGHALTLNHGLSVIGHLRDAGARRVFLDLKFHDIPNSVALAVREATRHGAWMITVHIAGGPAMMAAAAAEAREYGDEDPPCIVGVSVLTSLDQHTLTDHLGVHRTVEEHMVYLSKLAVDCDLDGVVCSAHEIRAIRQSIGPRGLIVTPGIRLSGGDTHDQKRVGDASTALADGADYLVVGRALTSSSDPVAMLGQLAAVPA
jgi:orotidine-5'-phosphate decarboxylase